MTERRTISEVRSRSDRTPRESRRPVGFTINGHTYIQAPGRVEWTIARLFGRRDLMSYSLIRVPGGSWANVGAVVVRWWLKPVKFTRIRLLADASIAAVLTVLIFSWLGWLR